MRPGAEMPQHRRLREDEGLTYYVVFGVYQATQGHLLRIELRQVRG
ncbi:hypothetical protein [Methylobacterium sp. V23]|nr:hypothetical protein [Methylobacterium sp. V23]